MALDAFVRCTCIRDGKARPHPNPKRLTFDETGEPILPDEASENEWKAHDEWLGTSCEHEGLLLAVFLGNIIRVKNLGDFVRGLEGESGPRFPMLLGLVLYDGTHTGDWIAAKDSATLLQEVNIILQASHAPASTEKEFFESMKRLCDASIATGNPIVF